MQQQPPKCIIAGVLATLAFMASAQTNAPADIWAATSIPVYTCNQVPDGSIRVDGKLDEPGWKNKPEITFAEIKDGTKPYYAGTAKIIWDSEYLYVGYDLKQPDVWATVKPEEKKVENIMNQDPFVKFFIDPDGDGLDYLEFHVNPANARACLLVKWPIRDPGKQDYGLPLEKGHPGCNWGWELPGIKTAVQVEGTLNNSNDVDKGWSVEIALPWAALKEYSKSPCPPRNVKSWRCHIGRVYKPGVGATIMDNIYWTWPVLGVTDCHVPARWGILFFKPIETPATIQIVIQSEAKDL